jgi:hypothetical protein
LATRRAPGTIKALEREVSRQEVGSPVIEAAEELGGPRGINVLQHLQERFPDWADVGRALRRLQAVRKW